MARTVTNRNDGFFGISGEAATLYYADQRTAARVAALMDVADLPTATAPSTVASEAEQNAQIEANRLQAHNADDVAGDAAIVASSAWQAAGVAATAASVAQSAANLADADAAGAQATANAAGLAASAAQATATAAAATAAAATAATVPVFLDERFRARFRSLNPTGHPAIEFSELGRCYLAPATEATGDWNCNGGATFTNERPTSIKCPGGGPGTNNALHRYGSTALPGARSKKWHMGGLADFVGPVGAGSGEWRAFMLINAPSNLPALMVGMGLFADVSETKFSWRMNGDNGDYSCLSTVDYVPGPHVFEMWTIPDLTNGNVVEMWGAVDFETPIHIGYLRNNMPDGPLLHWHGAINGAGDMYLDAIGICSER